MTDGVVLGPRHAVAVLRLQGRNFGVLGRADPLQLLFGFLELRLQIQDVGLEPVPVLGLARALAEVPLLCGLGLHIHRCWRRARDARMPRASRIILLDALDCGSHLLGALGAHLALHLRDALVGGRESGLQSSNLRLQIRSSRRRVREALLRRPRAAGHLALLRDRLRLLALDHPTPVPIVILVPRRRRPLLVLRRRHDGHGLGLGRVADHIRRFRMIRSGGRRADDHADPCNLAVVRRLEQVLEEVRQLRLAPGHAQR